MQIPPYPPEFYYDVRSGYQTVIQRYEDALQELRKRRWLFDIDMSLTRRLRETAVFKKKTERQPEERADIDDLTLRKGLDRDAPAQ